MFKSRSIAYLTISVLATIHLLLWGWFICELRQYLVRRPTPSSFYSWVEEDVPERLTLIEPRPNVVMSFEESVRYGIHEPEADLEWLYTATREDQGNVVLGPNNRFLNVALTHQLHCLRAIRKALDADDVLPNVHHSEHCLSVLRQLTLCAADSTLEAGDSFARNFTNERVTGVQACMDVEAFHSTMWKLWTDWSDSQTGTVIGV
ncbi:hypothetical protein BD311DRAFT_760385, partial [Dichomitus squalens]